MPPVVMALIFAPLALISGWSILRAIQTGQIGDEAWTVQGANPGPLPVFPRRGPVDSASDNQNGSHNSKGTVMFEIQAVREGRSLLVRIGRRCLRSRERDLHDKHELQGFVSLKSRTRLRRR